MSRIKVEVEEIVMEGDRGGEIDSIRVICSVCDASVEIYGRSIQSIKRGCISLREQCDERNFYYYEEN